MNDASPKSPPAETGAPIHSPEPLKADKYAPGISRSFWIVLALSSAAVVLGMGRNEASQYQQAMAQLRALPKFTRSLSAVEQQISSRLEASIAAPLVHQIAQAAARQGTATDQADLLKKIKYYWVEEGPLSFDFSIPPTQLLKQIDELFLERPYTVKIPIEPTTNPELASAVEEALRKDVGTNRMIIDAEFSCNWANNQCDSELVLKGNSAGENVRRLKFFVPARQFVTTIRPLDVLGFPDASNAKHMLQVTQVRELENELAGKTFDQSLNYLAQRIDEKEGSIKVFDITFSGATAFLVLPIAIVGSLGWLLLQLRELGSLPLRWDDIRSEAMEIFYEDQISAWTVCLLIACVPVGALGLLVRIAPSNRLDVLSVLFVAIVLAGLLSYLVLRQRTLVRKRVIPPDPTLPP